MPRNSWKMNKFLKINFQPTYEDVEKASNFYFGENPKFRYNFKTKFENASIALFYLNEKIIGFICFTEINKRLLWIDNIYITENFRSKGFGEELVNLFLNFILSTGFYVATLSSSSEESTRFWKKSGFIKKSNQGNDPKLFYKLLVDELSEDESQPYSEQIIIKGKDKNYTFNFTADSISREFKNPIIINEFEDCEIIWKKNNIIKKSILKLLPNENLIIEDIAIIEKSIFD